jgi:hypothetical protein
MDQEKRPWRAPELIDVGDVSDVTEGMSTNVRDGAVTQVSYEGGRSGTDEVDLEQR